MAVLANLETTTAPVAVVPATETHVAKAVTALVSAFTAFDERAAVVRDFSDKTNKARVSDRKRRETLIVKLAKTSTELDLTKAHIDEAIKQAVKQWPEKQRSTLNQFSSEARRAMLPATREHVAACFEIATKYWNAEQAAVKANEEARELAAKKR